MRHVRSILYALVLAPAVWILCGVGFTQDLTGRAQGAGSVETTSAILLLVLAGAAYALLIFSPISPLGPALFGLLFLVVNLWAVVAPDSYAGVWPAAITKDGFDLSRPGYALAALLAIPMLCTALSVRRWRGYEPPQLPLIGTLGRARGAAVAPGTPVAAERTAIITTSDATEVIDLPVSAEPPTEAVPTQAVPVVDADEPTVLVGPAPAPADEPTVLVTPTPAAPADEATAEQSGDAPTALVTPTPAAPAEEATAEGSSDEPTVVVAAAPADEPKAPSPVADDAGVPAERSSDTPASSDEPTIASAQEPADPTPEAETDEPAVASAQPAESTPEAEIDEPAEAAPAVEEPAGVDPDEIKDAIAAEDAAAVDAEETAEPLPDETVAEVADAEPVVGPDDEPAAADEVGPPTTPYDSKPAIDEDTETAGARSEPIGGPGDDPTLTPGDEPTEAGTSEVDVAPADDEPTVAHPRQSDDESAEAHTGEAGTITADVAEDGEERTQIIGLPVARTEADPDEPTRLLQRGDRTQTAAPGETTQVIFWRQPVNQTTPEEAARAQAAADQAARDRAAQERSRQAFRDRAAQERAKAAFAERAAQDAREHGEQTQVINLAGPREQPIPGDQTQVLSGAGRTGDRTQTPRDATTGEPAGDQTQVIRSASEPAGDHTQVLPGGATVEPPGDRTQVLSFPFPFPRPAVPPQNPGERTTDKQEPPTRANSIVGAEQPDPGADPTTRLSLLRPAVQSPGEDTTADVGDNRRTRGLLDLERPADESADDTRRLVIPPPRRPEDDEPTTRL